MANEEIGKALGRHRTLIARVVKQALKKVRDQGFDLRDIIEPPTPGPSLVTRCRKR